MIFCVLLLAMVGIVAFFQFTQGFFSATISAILATIAAVVALGWYEQVAPLLFNAKIFDQAASISMILIFAITYLIPRLVIDSLVPGNVRVPFIMEKAGAVVMGLIAGLMSVGVVAAAADALPFGPTIGMYSRFSTADDKDKTFMGPNGVMQDTTNNDVMTGDKIDPDDPSKSHVWFAMDDLVVGLENKISAPDGSLSNGRPMGVVHPDLLDEWYGQRVGIQPAAKHSAVNTEQTQPVSVKGVYTPPQPIPQVDGEQPSMRPNGYQPPPPTIVADADHIVLVVRMSFAGKDLADDDNKLRYSLGAIRLAAGQGDGSGAFKDYYPVATLDTRGTAVAWKPDDFLLSDMSGARTVDFVFVVDRDHVMTGDEIKPPFHLPPGTFVAFKRYGICDLSGKQVEYGPPPNPDKTPMLMKPPVEKNLASMNGIWTGATAANESAGGGSSAGAQASAEDNGSSAGSVDTAAGNGKPLGDSGLGFVDITVSNKLALPINCATGDDNATVQLSNGVGGELAKRQWVQLTVTGQTPSKTLGEPQTQDVRELAVDPNTVLVQVQCAAPVSGSMNQMWAWGKRISDFALADATGHTYPCVGAWATVQRGTEHYFVVNYKNFDDKNHIQAIAAQKGRPVNVWLAFQVPSGTPLAEVRFSAKTAVDNLNFKAQ